jgi:phospholipid/cholesterol/gamma-HCH transport system permease protein
MSALASRMRSGLIGFGDGAEFSARVLGRTLVAMRLYLTEVLRQATILARGSVPIVLALVFAFGLVLGIQSSYGARLVGAPSLAALGPAIGGLRELIPYAFAYMMAAKVSTGFVAEIGTMRITDEIDALDVMGMNTIAYLCSTRILATWVVLPFVYGIAIVVGYVASYITVVLQVGQVSAGGYFALFWKFQSPPDLVFSGLKGMLMGAYVVLVGVWFGYRATGGPVGVGRATARAMVVNLIGIHIIGVVTSELFWGGSSRLPVGG